jgi:hypothetical protein
MTSFVTRNRPLLSAAAALAISVAGVLLHDVALSILPSIIVACLLFAFAVSICAGRIDTLLFNRGSQPDACPAGISVEAPTPGSETTSDAEPIRAASEPAVDAAELADDPGTVEHLSEEIFELRMLLAAERELTGALVGDLSPEQVDRYWGDE